MAARHGDLQRHNLVSLSCTIFKQCAQGRQGFVARRSLNRELKRIANTRAIAVAADRLKKNGNFHATPTEWDALSLNTIIVDGKGATKTISRTTHLRLAAKRSSTI